MQGQNRATTRAVLGSVVGSALTLLLLVGGPQVIQRSIAIGSNGWPVALAVSALAAYVAGFVGNRQRPRGWPAIWIGGWLIGALLVVTFVAVFGTSGD